MQHQPNRHREKNDGEQTVPGPVKVMRLDRIDRNHEVIGESRVSQKGPVFKETLSQPAKQRESSERQHQKGNEQINWDGLDLDRRRGRQARMKIDIKPLRAGPKKAEPSLQRGAKIRFG